MSHTYALVIKSLTREMLDEEKSFIWGIELPHSYEYDTKKECVDVKYMKTILPPKNYGVVLKHGSHKYDMK